jgi:O-acetyl-ADP-ribose deacetylase (regulator of RNase III)
MNPSTDIFEIGSSRVWLMQGDITQQDTDAVVNAANPSLLGGGGVDGAIHRAGGPTILEECKEIVEKIGHCETGEAVITTGGDMSARHVIHTVGPVYRGGQRREPEMLANAYKNSCRLAAENGLKSIAFPSISTGAYGYPIKKAAEIALRTVFTLLKERGDIDEVRIVLFSDADLKVYRDIAPIVHEELAAK